MSHPLLEQVRSVKRQACRLIWLCAIMFTISAVVAAALIAGSADYVFRSQDVAWRIAGSVSIVAVLLFSFFRFVFPAARHHSNDIEAAQRIERNFPQLSDRLSTAVAFLEQLPASRLDGSHALREATVHETSRLVGEIPLNRCLDPRPAWRAALVMSSVLVAVLLALVVDPSSSALAARRLLLPLSREAWPRRNALAWTKQPRRLAVGTDFRCVLKDLNGRLPDSVTLYWVEGNETDSPQWKPMEIVGDTAVGQLANVGRAIRYRAAGGDDNTMPWTTLEVIEPARVSELDIRLEPPAYMQLPAATSGRHIRAWAGTRVTLDGRLDRPVRAATLVTQCGGKPSRIEARMERGGRRFVIPSDPQHPWVVGESGKYWLELEDVDGFSSKELVDSELRVQKDLPPTVSLAGPSSGASFTAKATVPIRTIAKDDLAIRSVELEFGKEKKELYRVVEPTGQPSPAAKPLATGETRVVEFAWKLSDLQGLAPGDTLEFRLAASDRVPQYGHTAPIRFTIISPEELEARIDQRQSNLSQRLRDALETETSVRQQTEAVERPLLSSGQLRREDADAIQSVELSQRSVLQILTDPKDGVVPLIDVLLEELKSNAVERPQLIEQLGNLRTSVVQIGDEPLAQIQFEMARLVKLTKTELDASAQGDRQSSAPAKQVPLDPSLTRLLQDVKQLQSDVIARLEKLVDSLSGWEDYRRLAQDVASIRQKQSEIASETQSLTTTGQDVASLAPETKANLKRLTQRQLDLARELDRLQGRLTSGAEAADRPDADSATIQRALDAMRKSNLSGRMRQGAQHLDTNRIGQASQVQQSVLQGLADLLDLLSRREDTEQSGNQRTMADAQTQLDSIAELERSLGGWVARQQSLAEKTKSLAQNADTPARKDLAEQQRQLGHELEPPSKNPRVPPAHRLTIERAARSMLQASQHLDEGNAGRQAEHLQEQAIRILQRMLESIASRRPGNSESPGEPPAEPKEESRKRISVAELILLRGLQEEINERTASLAAIANQRPGEPQLQYEYNELAADQARLVEILQSALADDREKETPKAATQSTDSELDRALEEAGMPGFSRP